MKPDVTNPDTLNRDMTKRDSKAIEKIDQALSADEQLVPSSGFLSAVMERVHEEAAAPPPIPFPWKRALPGILLAVAVFGWALWQLLRYLPQAVGRISFSTPQLSVASTHDLLNLGWIALACVIWLFSWWLSSRLTRRSGGF